MQLIIHDLHEDYKGKNDAYISFISDSAFPVLGFIPNKTFNQILFLIDNDAKSFRYDLKKRGNTSNGIVYESPDMQIPSDFIKLKGLNSLTDELNENINTNFSYLKEKL